MIFLSHLVVSKLDLFVFSVRLDPEQLVIVVFLIILELISKCRCKATLLCLSQETVFTLMESTLMSTVCG